MNRLPEFSGNLFDTIFKYRRNKMPSNYNTQTDTLTGVSTAAENPGGMTMDNTTIGSITPKPGTFTTLTYTSGSTTTSTASQGFILSAAIANASTSTTMNVYKPALVGSSTAAKVYPLAAPGSTGVGIYKYIRCRSATTSRKCKISVSAASATINNSKTVITLSNTGDAVTLFGETSTRWGIAGSFVAGTTRIATS